MRVPEMMAPDEVNERIADLRNAQAPYMRDRIRIKAIVNGGPEGIKALMGVKAATRLNSEDLPVVQLMESGLNKLGRRLGRAPDIKVDIAADENKTDRKRAEKRERILVGLDYQTHFELGLPLAGRWLPGYAFAPWVILEGKGRDGQPYAKAEVRNSFDCFPGQWGPDTQPEEIAFIRVASRRRLAARYPQYQAALDNRKNRPGPSVNGPFYGNGVAAALGAPGRSSWEGPSTSESVMIAEYLNSSGTYLVALDEGLVLDWVPNPLTQGPAFSLAKRPTFDKLKGQYDSVIGLMAMMAKLNVLAFIANEDAVFRETNIIGNLIGKDYHRGRKATNFLTPGSRVEKPNADISYQVFQQIDRVERQLRVGAEYPVIQDAENPGSGWATGRGLDRLSAGDDHNIDEYQQQMQYAIEDIDQKRLEWERVMYPNMTKTVRGHVKGVAIKETYVPSKDINDEYGTRRAYGVMAGYDQPEVIVTGLQLVQGEIIDVETMQDNMYGLENKGEINNRVRKRKAENMLFNMLSQAAGEKDPRAEQAMVEIYQSPDRMDEILADMYVPEEAAPEMMPQMMGAPGGAPELGQPEAVSTVLSRLMSSGQADGGVQTVGRL